jgi:hypothetical protein
MTSQQKRVIESPMPVTVQKSITNRLLPLNITENKNKMFCCCFSFFHQQLGPACLLSSCGRHLQVAPQQSQSNYQHIATKLHHLLMANACGGGRGSCRSTNLLPLRQALPNKSEHFLVVSLDCGTLVQSSFSLVSVSFDSLCLSVLDFLQMWPRKKQARYFLDSTTQQKACTAISDQ